MMATTDLLNRPLRDLRISVTDRCNFRCVYCMPKEIFGANYPFLPHADVLTFEEITRLAGIFASHGVEKIRLTGGEPLVRRNIEDLVAMLVGVEGIHDIAMTTNGSLLSAKKAQALKAAGLQRITISLDSLDDTVFKSMNDVNFPVAKVLQAIDNAAGAGLSPVKIDMVVKRGYNADSILGMAEHFRGNGIILRFIEFMDVGNTNGWRMEDVVSAREILDTIDAKWPIEAVEPNYTGEVATRWRYRDGGGEFGIIASVTMPFCGNCTRVRLSADGQLYTCLFGTRSHDFRALLRGGASDDEVFSVLGRVWGNRADRYSELRSENTAQLKKVEMSRIGG
ncbi:MAG TPA: GTP 3',8-cyclase MoaA [Thermomicrobiales bacterium]|nr:GTP 3',8-cyclase MoaA [Thermomicrobiales bacterium]HRA32717.1 GTP 3',8-cyclase MoaA [Thermomicrobiales bacterium]